VNLATNVIGRRLAARYLTRAGLVVLDLDWRSPTTGELFPIVARARIGSVLVVCHVHTHSHVTTIAPYRVTPPVQWRAGAAEWVAGTGLRPAMARFDRVLVSLPRRGPARVEHTSGPTVAFPSRTALRSALRIPQGAAP
jgi:putative endonuclease